MKETKNFTPPSGEWTQADKNKMSKIAKWHRNTLLSRHGCLHFNQWFDSLENDVIKIFEEATQHLVSEFIAKTDNSLFGATSKDLPVSTTYMLKTLGWDIAFFLRIGKSKFDGVPEHDYMLRSKLIRMYSRKLLAKVYRSKPKAEWLKLTKN